VCVILAVFACKKQVVQNLKSDECKSCNEIKITNSRILKENDPLLISILNNDEIKSLNKSFGELDLNQVKIYDATTYKNAAISIKFTSKPNVNSKLTLENTSNTLLVYLGNNVPNVITVQQFTNVNIETNSGKVSYFEPNGNELLNFTVQQGQTTSMRQIGEAPPKKETWVKCMQRALAECAEDPICTITCIFLSEPCAVGFALGCGLQQMDAR
jgi:hypothetical protein